MQNREPKNPHARKRRQGKVQIDKRQFKVEPGALASPVGDDENFHLIQLFVISKRRGASTSIDALVDVESPMAWAKLLLDRKTNHTDPEIAHA